MPLSLTAAVSSYFDSENKSDIETISDILKIYSPGIYKEIKKILVKEYNNFNTCNDKDIFEFIDAVNNTTKLIKKMIIEKVISNKTLNSENFQCIIETIIKENLDSD